MAKQGELVFQLTTIFLVLLIPTPAMSRVEGGMNVVLKNNMNEDVGVFCYIDRVHDFGTHIVHPGGGYYFYIQDSAGQYSGLKYHCNFAASGKPRTSLKVFDGTGGLNNEPCECTGDFCDWTITNEGFSCNSNHYSHRWGN